MGGEGRGLGGPAGRGEINIAICNCILFGADLYFLHEYLEAGDA